LYSTQLFLDSPHIWSQRIWLTKKKEVGEGVGGEGIKKRRRRMNRKRRRRNEEEEEGEEEEEKGGKGGGGGRRRIRNPCCPDL
jgi:hypothetical protein